jgi:predicted DNA-binding transcriptional regulator AlpA
MNELIDHEAVNAKTGPRSKVQRWRDVKAGKFPPPVKVGSRNLWVAEEIEAWIAERIAERDSRKG